jgi:hypothetical protein
MAKRQSWKRRGTLAAVATPAIWLCADLYASLAGMVVDVDAEGELGRVFATSTVWQFAKPSRGPLRLVDVKIEGNQRLVTYEVDELQHELPLRQLVDGLVEDWKSQHPDVTVHGYKLGEPSETEPFEHIVILTTPGAQPRQRLHGKQMAELKRLVVADDVDLHDGDDQIRMADAEQADRLIGIASETLGVDVTSAANTSQLVVCEVSLRDVYANLEAWKPALKAELDQLTGMKAVRITKLSEEELTDYTILPGKLVATTKPDKSEPDGFRKRQGVWFVATMKRGRSTTSTQVEEMLSWSGLYFGKLQMSVGMLGPWTSKMHSSMHGWKQFVLLRSWQ